MEMRRSAAGHATPGGYEGRSTDPKIEYARSTLRSSCAIGPPGWNSLTEGRTRAMSASMASITCAGILPALTIDVARESSRA